MRLTRGTYTTDNSDLAVEVIKVSYQTSEYARIKINLYNKYNGIVYETRSNYKVIKKRIAHWKKGRV